MFIFFFMGFNRVLWFFLWVLMIIVFFSGAFYVMFAGSMYGPCKKGFRSLLFGKSGTD